MARVVERQFKQDGIEVMLGTKVEGVSEQKTGVKVQGRRQGAEGRPPGDRRRPPARHRAAQPRRRRSQDRGGRPDQDRRIPADLRRGRLRDRRPRPRTRPGPQGLRGGRGRGRDTPPAQQTHPIDVDLVAGATFCHPQVASVGMTEEQAKEAGKQIKVGKFKLGGAGASVVYDDRAGLVKIVGDPEYGEILGAHIVGNIACDMISELVERDGARGRLPGARPDHPSRTRRCPRRSWTPPAPSTAGRSTRRDRQPHSAAACGATASPMSDRATFYYDFSSPYSYLAAERISGLFAEAEAEQPEWQPISFGHVLKQSGRRPWSFERGPQRPTSRRSSGAPTSAGCPRSSIPRAGRSRTTASPRCGRRSTPRSPAGSSPSASPPSARCFAAGRDLSDVDNVLIAAAACELHPNAVLKGIETASVKDGLQRGDRARRSSAGVEGVPRSRSGDELFWGDDRLEEAVAAAVG